jgi:hypothetical protein
MSDMKCPICGGEMIGNIGSPICHYNQDCPIHDRSIPQEIYDLLDRTHNALDVAVDALKRLEKELYFNNAKQTGHIADSVMSIPSIALEQITALEQKDVK